MFRNVPYINSVSKRALTEAKIWYALGRDVDWSTESVVRRAYSSSVFRGLYRVKDAEDTSFLLSVAELKEQ